MRISAVCTAIGGVIAAFLVGRTADVRPVAHPAVGHACNDPGVVIGHTQRSVSDTGRVMP